MTKQQKTAPSGAKNAVLTLHRSRSSVHIRDHADKANLSSKFRVLAGLGFSVVLGAVVGAWYRLLYRGARRGIVHHQKNVPGRRVTQPFTGEFRGYHLSQVLMLRVGSRLYAGGALFDE